MKLNALKTTYYMADSADSTETGSGDLEGNGYDGGLSRVTDSDAAVNAVAENSPVGTRIGFTALATAGGETVTYELTDDVGGKFAIDAQTGEVTVAGELDYETATYHIIVVRATSSSGSTTDEEFYIAVTDADESLPVNLGPLTDTDTADNVVDENSPVGTTVGVVARADNADTYSLVDDADGLFAIDAHTGEITVAGNLNYEAADSHTVRVRATGAGGSREEDFTIAVRDVNEPPIIVIPDDDERLGPVTDSDVADNAVDENSPAGTTVGVVARADNADTYSLVDDAGGLFSIDAQTGEITVAGNLNYEAAVSHTVRVRATGAGGSREEDFIIAVRDVNEPPVIIVDSAPGLLTDADTADNAVDENSPVGTTVGVVARADNADTYSLVDDAGGRFSIDAQTGEITVAGNLNYEAINSHTVRVRATGAGGSREEDFIIAVRDVNEPPVIIVDSAPGLLTDADTADNAVDENSPVGTAVGVVARADNADTYSLVDDADGRFAIDAQTGEVTVAGNLNHEAADSHTVRVRASGAGGSREEDFTIAVRDVNEPPRFVFFDRADDSPEAVENAGYDVGMAGSVSVDDWYTGPVAQPDNVAADSVMLRNRQVNQLVSAMAALGASQGDGSVVPEPGRDTLQSVLVQT